MIEFKPKLMPVAQMPMTVTDSRHYSGAVKQAGTKGAEIAALGGSIGAGAVTFSQNNKAAGGFADAMLQALDGVSADQNLAGNLAQAAISDPGSVDPHDVTIAQAKAKMSLDIAQTLISRMVQGWRDITNLR
jgi:flagellar hook-basal body complex protein FliE